MKVEFLNSVPPGTIAICHPGGWMQNKVFVQWLIACVNPKQDEPVLQLLDGHTIQTENLPLTEIVRQNGDIVT
jgi:hypothetical protein